MKVYQILNSNFQVSLQIKADCARILKNGTVVFYKGNEECMILAAGIYGAVRTMDSPPEANVRQNEKSTDSPNPEPVLKESAQEISDADVEVVKEETAKLEAAKGRAEALFNAKRKLAGVKLDLEVLLDKVNKLDMDKKAN